MPHAVSSRPLTRRARLFAVLASLLVLVPVTATRLPAQDLDEVERQVEQLETQLEHATQRFEDVRGKVEAARTELDALEGRARELEQQAEEADEALATRAREAFKFGGDPVLASFLSSEGVQGAIERTQFLELVSGSDRAQLEQAIALRTQLDQTQQVIAQRAQELEAMEAQMAEQRDQLDEQLQARAALAADMRARAARQKRIENAVQNGVYACIHDSNSFVDTWGAPRSGGRSHKGTDVMAPYGVPVYAFTTGVITRMNHGNLGGIQLYIYGNDGNEYFYAHLSGYADTSYVGKHVEAGELVAYNGNTGNAAGGPSHVHFELHPGGGAAINPYPYLRAAC